MWDLEGLQEIVGGINGRRIGARNVMDHTLRAAREYAGSHDSTWHVSAILSPPRYAED